MKKSTIWAVAVIMGSAFLALLYLQSRYFQQVFQMRKQQFDENVSRSLYQAARDLELKETYQLLKDSITKADKITNTTNEADTAFRYSNLEKEFPSLHLREARLKRTKEDLDAERLRKNVTNILLHREGVLEEVINEILYKPSAHPLSERISSLDTDLKRELNNNGINLTYHFYVTNSDGDTIYKCPDYVAATNGDTYKQVLFANDPRAKVGILYIHFPELQRYLFSEVKFIWPATIFTFLLLFMFIFTIYTIFRQKRLSEMKNDFVNNMTHEFKTPISSISLAAQMLQDPSVNKSEAMLNQLTRVINDETRRLRFQVEKVLQMSLFDKKGGSFKLKEIDTHKMICDVVNTFRLKVESSGGTLTTNLAAKQTTVYGDIIHLTNVVFNLLDNAVKYKSQERALHLNITSKNQGEKIIITIQDNGIGIKHDDLEKIFVRFYRAHTGNRHDVKGFGLGLAYVKNVVGHHKGTIQADSELGVGTKFIITLPIIKQ